MTITLYWHPLSPPSRAVRAIMKELGIDAEYKEISLFSGENKTPEFLKINPLGQVPALTDGDLNLWESRAIQAYLVDKYGNDDKLYPKDIVKRAKLTSYMYKDTEAFRKMAEFFVPQILHGEEPDQEKEESMKKVLDFIESSLHPYFLGDEPTLPDLAMAQNFVQIESLIGYDLSPWPKVKAIVDEIKKKDYFFELKKPGS